MAQTIRIKRSAVQNKVPLTTDLQLGELAINTYDGKLYTKKDNGTASIVEIGAGGGGGSISISDDTTTNATYYLGMATATSGTLSALTISSTKLTFNPSTGNLVAGGTVTANSDEKLKTNVKTLENALDKVLNLRGVEFDRVDTGEHQIGVIAQEVEKVVPDVVYPKGPAPDYETKSVAYANLVGLLIEAIKEQNLRIEYLEAQLQGLTGG